MEQKQSTTTIVGHILAAARHEADRMAKVMWAIGFAAPIGLATLAGRTHWPAVGWAANLLPWWGWLIVASYVALLYLLYAVGARGASLEAAHKPRLDILFDNSNPLCFHETFFGKDSSNKGIYVAVLPRALTAAPIKDCVGWLSSVSELGDDGEWHGTSFVHRRKMEWGASGWEPVDIDSKTNQVLNVFFVKESDPRIHMTIAGMLNKDKGIFDTRDKKVRRFDIVICDESGVAAEASLKVQLGEDWRDIRVEKICPAANT